MSKQPRGRVLPPNFKHVVEMTFRQRFTWRQRFLIALGCAARIKLAVWTEHGPGRVKPVMEIDTEV